MIHEFAVKKETLNSGEERFTPVTRERKRKFGLYENEWKRIVCIYGKYTLIPIDWEPVLSYQQCEEHIEGYKQELKQKIADKLQTVEFHNLENTEI